MRSVVQQIAAIDRSLQKYAGLATDPQARDSVNSLLDIRLEFMAERDRGFQMRDRRRLSGLT